MDVDFPRHYSELVALERSGHTAVVEDNLLYVWGGYTTTPDEAEVFLPNNDIWVYDLEQGVWKVFHMTGEVPPSMSGTCSCYLNGHMYIFGGCDDNGQTNKIYCVDLTDGKYMWRKIIHETGSAPSPRDKLSCWVYGERIIYFGGYGLKLPNDVDRRNGSFILDEASRSERTFWGWNNEVHIFDPDKASWIEPQTHGCGPAPRAAHASATIGARGYIFGGRVKETRTNDTHCLDLQSWTWSEIIPASFAPQGRSWHTLTAVSNSTLFLFGGVSVDCIPKSDGWLFDVETKKWRKIDHCYKNKPRLWHTACIGRDSDVVVFGGSCDYIVLYDSGHCNDVLVFQMQPYPLLSICKDYIAKRVGNCEMLKKQLPLLPPRILSAIQTRMTFYRTSQKQRNKEILVSQMS